MEMVYGALNAPRQATNAFFYMLDESRKSELDDLHGSASYAKLLKLRERIRQSDYPFREGIRNATELGQLVLEDFKKFINSQFPEQTHEDPLESYRKTQVAWASSQTVAYVANENTKLLQRETFRNSLPIVLVGETGAGKSSLLAHLMNGVSKESIPVKPSILSKLTKRLLGRTQRIANTHFDLEIFHFVESSYESAMVGKNLTHRAYENLPFVVRIHTRRIGILLKAERYDWLRRNDKLSGITLQFFLNFSNATLSKRLTCFNMPADQRVCLPRIVPLREVLCFPMRIDASHQS